jgi:PAS domain S-box-containing protein
MASFARGGKSLRVLLVEDSDEDARLLMAALEAGGYDVQMDRVQTSHEMRSALAREDWQIVLSDYRLPRFTGLEALSIAKETQPELPFIMLSGTIGEDAAVAALQAGASDFLVKGQFARLIPAIERELREVESRRLQRAERRALTAELQALQTRSAYALDAAGSGVWELDLLDSTTRWTEAVSVLLGLPPEPVQTGLAGFLERIHRDDLPAVERAFAQAVDREDRYAVECRVSRPDGVVRWISLKGRVSRNAHGTPISMVGICLDVTNRKQLEQQLQQAQKLDALGKMAGGIAHDFNNILSVILGFSELLLDDSDPASPRGNDLAEIKKAAEAGQRLTKQLLAFSRQQSITPASVDLNVVIDGAGDMVRRILAKCAEVEIALTASRPQVWADVGQIEQIVMNLTINARDAMKGRGRLSVGTANAHIDADTAMRHDVPAGDYVVLTVSDTGAGMSPETMSRIFEPFFTTKEPGKGTGLGLSTVYGIVRQSRGFMDVHSILGQGTTFRVYLPVHMGQPTAV